VTFFLPVFDLCVYFYFYVMCGRVFGAAIPFVTFHLLQVLSTCAAIADL